MNTKRNPVGWFEIYVSDLERAKAFYEAVFETRLEEIPPPEGASQGECTPPTLLMFPAANEDMSAPGCTGALVKMDGMDPGKGGSLIYFSCADCGVEAARVKENGGQIVQEKFSIGQYGDIAIAMDPEGNMIGLHNPPAGAACNS